MARDVRDLVKKPPEGIRLVLDDETGMPGSLSEIMVRLVFVLYCLLEGVEMVEKLIFNGGKYIFWLSLI